MAGLFRHRRRPTPAAPTARQQLRAVCTFAGYRYDPEAPVAWARFARRLPSIIGGEQMEVLYVTGWDPAADRLRCTVFTHVAGMGASWEEREEEWCGARQALARYQRDRGFKPCQLSQARHKLERTRLRSTVARLRSSLEAVPAAA